MKRKSQQVVAYGSGCVDPQGNWRSTGMWHADCHGPMRRARGQYALSMDRVLYLGFEFKPTDNCAYCGKPLREGGA